MEAHRKTGVGYKELARAHPTKPTVSTATRVPTHRRLRRKISPSCKCTSIIRTTTRTLILSMTKRRTRVLHRSSIRLVRRLLELPGPNSRKERKSSSKTCKSRLTQTTKGMATKMARKVSSSKRRRPRPSRATSFSLKRSRTPPTNRTRSVKKTPTSSTVPEWGAARPTLQGFLARENKSPPRRCLHRTSSVCTQATFPMTLA